ncbi:ankyrin repeat domain-containing protein [Acinetobacter sp.]|uniref:ankyrin repeat domain-containing protein n=1 Tax=Acinetobacter sp. TaxID=472 RepID=UPI0031D181EA
MIKFYKYLISFVLLISTPNIYAQYKEINGQQELIDLFFAAARIGNIDVINEFLNQGFPVNVRNSDNYTALMIATYHGQHDIVNALIEHGADVCLRDSRGHTAVMGAIVKAEWKIARQLKKVDCDSKAKQENNLTTDEFAKVFGQEEKWKRLLETSK